MSTWSEIFGLFEWVWGQDMGMREVIGIGSRGFQIHGVMLLFRLLVYMCTFSAWSAMIEYFSLGEVLFSVATTLYLHLCRPVHSVVMHELLCDMYTAIVGTWDFVDHTLLFRSGGFHFHQRLSDGTCFMTWKTSILTPWGNRCPATSALSKLALQVHVCQVTIPVA